ncbi:MAG: apolipoprotein N-acyltransferase [Bacteriovoracaceae bacterium]
MQTQIIGLIVSFFAGALYALAYPSAIGNGWFPLIFIALPLFLWKLEEANLKQGLALIFCYNLGLDLVSYYWIPHTMREFGQLPYVISLLIGILFTFLLQPHWWVYLFVSKKMKPDWKWNSETGILFTAFVITLLERYVPQQFPSFVGSAFLHLAPYLGMAPYFGVAIFSFMLYWLSLEVVAQLKLKKFRPFVWICFSLFLVSNVTSPLKLTQSSKALKVRIVQANIGNFLKISSEKGETDSVESIDKKYYQLSTIDNGFKPDLIVWPETAYPNAFYGTESSITSPFREIIQATDAEMLIGGYDQDLTKSPMDLHESVFNSSLLLNAERVKSSYHKNILIPFGETLPFGPLNRQIVSIIPAISLFARGTGTPLMETRQGYRFVTPICYEILESDYMRYLLNQWKDNHFIVNHTNDSWYGKTAEPFQHLFLSKWRALEFQLPIIRSTNTGITSIIYPDGSESNRLLTGEESVLDVVLPIGEAKNTFYQLYGIAPLILLIAFFLIITAFREKSELFSKANH